MASASARISVAPLDEKVVEKQVQNTQYALKFVGAAFSSAFYWLLLTRKGLQANHTSLNRYGILCDCQSHRHVGGDTP